MTVRETRTIEHEADLVRETLTVVYDDGVYRRTIIEYGRGWFGESRVIEDMTGIVDSAGTAE